MCLCFDLYDADHNGQISLEEADFMLQDVFGAEWATNDEARALHIWLHERDAALLGAPDLGIDDWSTFVSANLHIQAAAVRTRLILQKKVPRSIVCRKYAFPCVFTCAHTICLCTASSYWFSEA